MDAKWHHVAMAVRNMESTLHFYRDLLGFDILWEKPHYGGAALARVVGLDHVDARVVMLSGFGTCVELFKYYSPAGHDRGPRRMCDFGLTHFALSVKDIHGLYHRLSVAGVPFNCPPQNLRPGVWATYMKDPEGVTVELVEYE